MFPLRSILGAALVALLATAPGAQAVTLSLEPADQVSATGGSVSVDLVISGLGDFAAPSLGDFDLDVGFDPLVLSLTGFALGPFLGDVGLGEALDLSLGELFPGLVGVAEVSLLEPDAGSCIFCIAPFLDDIQPDSFPLATFFFDVLDLDPGESTTVFIGGIFALGDGFGLPLPLDATADAVIRNPGVALPAPHAALLLLAGLAGLGWTRQRRS